MHTNEGDPDGPGGIVGDLADRPPASVSEGGTPTSAAQPMTRRERREAEAAAAARARTLEADPHPSAPARSRPRPEPLAAPFPRPALVPTPTERLDGPPPAWPGTAEHPISESVPRLTESAGPAGSAEAAEDPIGTTFGLPVSRRSMPWSTAPVPKPSPPEATSRDEDAAPAGLAPFRPGDPLLPSTEPGPPTVEEIERLTQRERIGIVLAVLAAPVGLVMSIVNAVASRTRRGWVPTPLRVAIGAGVVLSLVVAVVGGVLIGERAAAIRHDELRVASTRFCAILAETPEMIQPPSAGWPAPAASIPESIAAMQDFAARWAWLAVVSPPEIRADATEFAAAATSIVREVARARVIDDVANNVAISTVLAGSRIPAWHAEYCAAP